MIERRWLPETKLEIRVLFALLIAFSALWIASSYYNDPVRTETTQFQRQAQLPFDEREAVVGSRDHITVATGMDSPFSPSKAIYAFAPDGRLLYYDNSTVYGDVDPSPAGRLTVMTATHDYFRQRTPGCDSKCTWQQIRRINLTTGSHEIVYRYNTPGHYNSNWHDVDRLDDDRYLITGMKDDSAWIVNASTGLRTWQYDVQSDFPLTGGGPYEGDWAHLNDVGKLADGRIMLSLRNQDQVVFIDPDEGLQENWTLGCDDCHNVLYEQHNPDYIPEEQGGPALLVADSENDRIVEYQRVGDEWVLVWHWSDERLSWPRDADRLPNGNTLITDTHGNRLLEVNRAGEIVWQARIVNGYDAERLGTGDESAGGPSAVRANLTSRGAEIPESRTSTELANEGEWDRINAVTKWWHVAQFVFPAWVTIQDIGFGLSAVVVTGLWGGVELHWRGVRFRWPVTMRRGEEA